MENSIIATISAAHALLGFCAGLAVTSVISVFSLEKLKSKLQVAIDAKFEQDLKVDELTQEVERLIKENEQYLEMIENARRSLTPNLPPPSTPVCRKRKRCDSDLSITSNSNMD